MKRIFTAVILLMAAFTFSVAQITSIPAAAGGGGGAPTDAQYLVLAANGSLSAERVFTLDANMTGTDGGAGGAYTIGPDTAKMESRANAQAGGSNYSVTAGSSTVYTAALTPTLTAYTNGGVIRVKWDETCGATPTINVDTLGARKMYKRNGTSASTQLAAGECIANQINVLTYNSSLDSGTGGFETDIGGGVIASAIDFSQFILREDFCGVNNAGGGIWFGKYGWTVFSSGSTVYTAIRDANDPCIVNLQTGATDTNLARLQQAGLTSEATSGTPRINPTSDTNFDFYFVVQLGGTITNAEFAMGFCQVSGGYSDCLRQATSTQPGLWFKYSTVDSDTNWEFISCNTGGCTASVTDTGVAPAASTTYRFRMRSTTAGTYLVSVNGGSETSVTPASVANSNMEPFFIVKTATAAARTLQVREMALIWTGRTN